MPIKFKARWDFEDPHHADKPDTAMRQVLDNSKEHIRAIICEAYINGGFTEGTIANMLARAMADSGLEVFVRQGIHQVEDQGQHGDGFNLHIGTKLGRTNFHLNLHQNGRGRLYVSSISYGAGGATSQSRPNPAPN